MKFSGRYIGASFANQNLAGAELSGEFVDVDFSGATLTGARLNGTFVESDFTDADLTGADASDGTFVSADAQPGSGMLGWLLRLFR